jgi:hypothetical protein
MKSWAKEQDTDSQNGPGPDYAMTAEVLKDSGKFIARKLHTICQLVYGNQYVYDKRVEPVDLQPHHPAVEKRQYHSSSHWSILKKPLT